MGPGQSGSEANPFTHRSSEHVKEKGPERPPINCFAMPRAGQDFGCHVLDGATEGVRHEVVLSRRRRKRRRHQPGNKKKGIGALINF